MKAFADLVHRLSKGGAFVGGVFLIFAMLLLMANIFGRLTHTVFPGSYEVFELVMAIPVTFALVHAALQKAHVVVLLIVSRFPPRLGAAAEILVCFLSLAIWVLIAWGGAHLAYENGLAETTDVLGIPYLPLRIVWIFGLFLFCLTYVLDLYRAFWRFFEK